MRKAERKPQKVLVVDDDPEILKLLSRELQVEGYECATASGGAKALTLIREDTWDLILLDWTLPDFSGVEVCRRMRAAMDFTPVLMLTARDDITERVEALDAGADDYLTKPFSIEELLARSRARLRRKEVETSMHGEASLKIGDLELRPKSREVMRGGEYVRLSVREYDLLHYLLQNKGNVCRRDEILKGVWGPTFVGDDNLLDVYIRYLRKKLEPKGAPVLIQTIRGIGFIAKEGEIKT